MSRQILATTKGFSLMELMVTLALLQLVLMLSFPALRQAVANRVTQRSQLRGNSSFNLLRDIIRSSERRAQGFFAIQSYWLAINTETAPPFVRERVKILPIKHQPQPGSAILTYLHLKSRQTVILTPPATVAEAICRAEARDEELLLLITLKSITALRLKPPAPSCSLHNILLEIPLNGQPDSFGVFAIIPIHDLYSIYLDQMGNVRHLALMKAESQPVSENVDSFHLDGNNLQIEIENLQFELPILPEIARNSSTINIGG